MNEDKKVSEKPKIPNNLKKRYIKFYSGCNKHLFDFLRNKPQYLLLGDVNKIQETWRNTWNLYIVW